MTNIERRRSEPARQRALKNQIRRIEKRLQKLEFERLRFSRYRPVVFFTGLLLTYWLGWTPIIIAIIVMSVEAIYYNRIGKVIHRHQLWRMIKSTQIARMTLDWEHIPIPPLRPQNENHPFEIDLDLTGHRSLHHLLDMAISREGSQRLCDWLLQTPPDPQKIDLRQQLIKELIPLSRFRDKLFLHFQLVSKKHLDGEKLLRWLQVQTPSRILHRVVPFSIGLAVLNIILFLGYQLGWIPSYWLLSFAVYLVVYFLNLPRIKRNFDAVMLMYDELDKFKTVLRYLEAYPYGKNVHLQKLCAPFCRQHPSPSQLLKKITLLTTAVGLRMNPALALFLNVIVPWDLVWAFFIERYKMRCAEQFPIWVQTWAELEALVSLANFAYLHPDYTFPEILCEDNPDHGPIFQATKMGHPLIPAEQKVCNDFIFHELGEMTLLTGSNMAGKSTFLKTAGINLCLAYAGGPVNATVFQTRLFRIFTCIRIHDSIADGFSFFYAEVKRLKTLLDELQADMHFPPVFFLIDEIFKGTNSRERLIGSRAYIRHLSIQQGVGIIATHDLELGQLADQIPGLDNAHFRDNVVDGKMVFDYQLRPGLCPTTNALKIMRLQGLPLDPEPVPNMAE